MWYFKQTAKNLWQSSKGMIMDTRSPVHKLLDQIANSEQQIISTSKLTELSDMTYNMEYFDQTLELVLKRLKTFHYDLDEAKKNLNILIATNYLIKHGASGFVDELRAYINVFKKYQTLKQVKTYQEQSTQKQLDYQLQKIKSRAQHIQTLLQDKQKLLKQKQLSMLVKQKLKLYQKTKLSQMSVNSQQNKSSNSNMIKESQKKQKNEKEAKYYRQKLQGLMEKYLWKYVDKLDDKLQLVSQKVIQNIDKYILGQLPQNFQPQVETAQLDDQSPQKFKDNKQNKKDGYCSLEDDSDLMMRLQKQEQKGNTNLIDFQQVVEHEPHQVKKQQESLI